MFAFLVVFSYQKNSLKINNFSPLQNIVVDLYNILFYIKSIGCKKIILCTDIFDDSNEPYLLQLVLKGYVGSEIHTLISDMKKQKSYKYISCLDNLKKEIKEQCSKNEKILFYYSGHGSYDKLVIPKINKDDINIEYYHTRDLLEDILYNKEDKIQNIKNIFIILDACQLSGCGLPFIMKNNGIYHLSNNKIIFTKHNVICLTSSHVYDDVLISQNGSLLTHNLTKYLLYLQKKIAHYSKNLHARLKYDLKTLLEKIRTECDKKYSQTINMYSSHPDVFGIWLWLLGIKTKLNINYIPEKNISMIEKISDH